MKWKINPIYLLNAGYRSYCEQFIHVCLILEKKNTLEHLHQLKLSVGVKIVLSGFI